MPGKPFQSKLAPYEEEIRSLLQEGTSYRRIAAELNERYALGLSHNAVFSFMKTRLEKKPTHKQFYDGFPRDIRESLMQQVAAVWTHDSTAIEGNTLTLGETLMVLEHGLTISGKPLREHQEVYGHARAIDLINEMIQVDSITESDLFDLHKAVMDKSAMDYLRPIGNWKREENGTTGMKDGKPIYMEYASPSDTPHLMERWLAEFNQKLDGATTAKRAIEAYAWAHLSFVRVHPFFDGNGRMARLLANLPVLRGGSPPIVIDVGNRASYIELLWGYATQIGTIQRRSEFVPPHENTARFEELLRDNWNETLEMVETAKKQTTQREKARAAESPLEAGDTPVPPASSRPCPVPPASCGLRPVPPASSGLPETTRFNPHHKIHQTRRKNLPHWTQDECTYFVTFRLADSIAQSRIKEYNELRQKWEEHHHPPYSERESTRFSELFSKRVDQWLDEGAGSCILKNPDLARMVADTLTHFDGDRYELDEWVIMPNHVHVLVRPLGENQLPDILHSWKSFSANQINRQLKTSGSFWKKEYYDHIVRDLDELLHIRKYIRNNPATAGIRVANCSSPLEAGDTPVPPASSRLCPVPPASSGQPKEKK